MNNEQPTVEQSINQLVSALQESKGWIRDYADAVIRDAIDRKPAECNPVALVEFVSILTCTDGKYFAQVVSDERLSVGAELFTAPQPCPRCAEFENKFLMEQAVNAGDGVLLSENERLIAKVAELERVLRSQSEASALVLNTKQDEFTRAEAVIEKCKEYADMTEISYPKNAGRLLTAIKEYQEGKKS